MVYVLTRSLCDSLVTFVQYHNCRLNFTLWWTITGTTSCHFYFHDNSGKCREILNNSFTTEFRNKPDKNHSYGALRQIFFLQSCLKQVAYRTLQ